eukprot:XP_011673688.1 PREDICTED: E3 ubiquitin-protein ligase LNX-like [Strongylocentrotus purpuratus]
MTESSTPAPAPRNPIILCRTCGQRHQLHDNHVYDYCDIVDEELTCNICLQPLVNPMDTMCGHTFCMRCLRSVLNLHKFCPIDRRPLTQQDCRASSLIVRRSYMYQEDHTSGNKRPHSIEAFLFSSSSFCIYLSTPPAHNISKKTFDPVNYDIKPRRIHFLPSQLPDELMS